MEADSFLSTNLFNFNLNLLAGIMFPGAFGLRWRPARHLVAVYGWFGETLSILYLITVVLYLAIHARTLQQVCVPCFAVFVTAQSSSKYLYITAMKNRFQRFFDTWDDSFKNDRFLERKLKMMRAERRFVRRLSAFLVACMSGPICFWALSPIFPMVQSRGRIVAVPGVYPYNYTVSPWFEIHTLTGTYIAWQVTMQTVAFDTFFCTLASMQIIQLRHLRRSFGLIFESPRRPPAELRSLVRTWVVHHQQAIALGRDLCRLYSPVLAVQFATTTMLLCLGCFAIATQTLDATLTLMCEAYCISNMTQLLLLCWFGDRLRTESEGITLEGFGHDWFSSPKETRTDLKVIFQRSQTTLNISALGVTPLSSETFLKIVYSAFSYFLVMMQFVEKKKN